jgi:pre-mRNA-splicing factor RBM22/SLT11
VCQIMASGGSDDGHGPSEGFPLVCETCMGANHFVRMMKDPMGKPCRICDRPFDSFRWKPAVKKSAAGPAGGFKATTICKVCARLRNVCQSCLLDLQLALPAHVRDAVLDERDRVAALPSSEVGRNFQQDLYEKKVDLGIESSAKTPQNYQPRTLLDKLDQKGVTQQNIGEILSKLCPFFVKGTCDRGTNCVLKHEKPEILNELKKLYPPPPADKSFKTLFVGNIDTDFTDDDVKPVFEVYGQVESIRLLPQKTIGFVEMVNRAEAEMAVRELWGVLTIKGVQVRVDWAKSATPTDRTTKRKRDETSIGESAPAKQARTAEPVRESSPEPPIVLKNIRPPPGIRIAASSDDKKNRPKLVKSNFSLEDLATE